MMPTNQDADGVDAACQSQVEDQAECLQLFPDLPSIEDEDWVQALELAKNADNSVGIEQALLATTVTPTIILREGPPTQQTLQQQRTLDDTPIEARERETLSVEQQQAISHVPQQHPPAFRPVQSSPPEDWVTHSLSTGTPQVYPDQAYLSIGEMEDPQDYGQPQQVGYLPAQLTVQEPSSAMQQPIVGFYPHVSLPSASHQEYAHLPNQPAAEGYGPFLQQWQVETFQTDPGHRQAAPTYQQPQETFGPISGMLRANENSTRTEAGATPLNSRMEDRIVISNEDRIRIQGEGFCNPELLEKPGEACQSPKCKRTHNPWPTSGTELIICGCMNLCEICGASIKGSGGKLQVHVRRHHIGPIFDPEAVSAKRILYLGVRAEKPRPGLIKGRTKQRRKEEEAELNEEELEEKRSIKRKKNADYKKRYEWQTDTIGTLKKKKE